MNARAIANMSPHSRRRKWYESWRQVSDGSHGNEGGELRGWDCELGCGGAGRGNHRGRRLSDPWADVGDGLVSDVRRQPGRKQRGPHLVGGNEKTPDLLSSAGDPQTPWLGALDDLGPRILNVLRAAQDEAAQLVAAAQDEAAQLVAAAQDEAAQLVAAAQDEAQAIRENAEAETAELRDRLESEMRDRRRQLTVLRNEADRYADEHRREADLDASRIRAEAEAEVMARRKELDVAKGKLEEEGQRRQELIDASRAVEHWLSGTVSTLREVVAKLETVLEAPPAELDQTLLQEAQSVGEDVDRSGINIRKAFTPHAETEQPMPDRGELLVKRADADDWTPLDTDR